MIEIFVPPLEHRPDDILPLAEHFLTRASARASLLGVDRTLQRWFGEAPSGDEDA